jgi:transcriptional regulator with XRE-family HTH domain
MNPERLGNKLRSVRTSRDLTLDQVSSQLGVTPSYLSEIERGNKIPSLKVLCDLSTYLDLPSGFLRDVLEDPGDEVKSFGEMLKGRREELDMTRDELARAIGWPRTYIETVESDNKKVPEKFLSDLGKALQFPGAFFELSASEEVGKKVKFFRSDKGLTQEELAEKSGLSTSLVSKIEREQVKPSLQTLVKLSKALGVSPCCFVLQLGQDSASSGYFAGNNTTEPFSERETRLEEVISTIYELDREELDDLAEYLSSLRG